jgi:23S rRNA pseudouridine2605 synthase
MAKRAKKSAETTTPESTGIAPQNPPENVDPKNVELKQEPQEPTLQEKSESALDKEAEHRMQAESPAVPDDGEAEVEAQAADTFDAASDDDAHPHAEDEDDAQDEELSEDESDSDEDGDEDEEEEEEEEGETEVEDEAEAEFTPKPRPPAKLERLQKILAQAGVASRRSAETMIEEGRVQVNGKIVTELGTKADAGRDHIRVDGKLLHGAERLRYFILNKPKGFVTTVKDPERRPTVMQFFEKMPERLYPVGRLDYQTEGLLLVTNDGELANKLTKAASGVEKTYLVKVSGQPTEDQLEVLRGGVAIEKGKPGSGRVRTAPARVRQVRQGDNPWYEVVLIEGRNRELRKMFEEIGHFVEKIRRVGYGPLVLDQEPGHLRELEPGELELLRKAADGKLRTPKAKEVRRRNAADAGILPTVLPRPSNRPRVAPPAQNIEAGATRPAQYPSRKTSGPAGDREQAKPFRPTRPPGEGYRPAAGRTGAAPQRFDAGRPAAGKFAPRKPDAGQFGTGKPGPGKFAPTRPAWKKDDRTTARPPARFNAAEGGAGEGGEDRRGAYRGGQNTSAPGGAGRGRTGAGRTFGAKPAWNKTGGGDKPAYQRPASQRPAGPRRDVIPPEPTIEPSERRPSGLRIEAIEPSREETRRPPRSSSAPPRVDRATFDRPKFDRAGSNRTGSERTGSERPRFDRPRPSGPRTERPAARTQSDRPRYDKPGFDKPRFDKPRFDKPKFEGTGTRRASGPPRSGARPTGSARPPRGESGLARPYTTSSGIPRAGGARPNNKSGRPASKTGWKPKPSFGAGKPASGGKSRPPAGGSRSAGGKKSSPRPGGKRH